MKTWEELEEKCLHCDRCELCRTRHNVVFGVGNRSSRLLFVGEGPGEQEDLQGVPFVGPAGKLLDDMLSIIDLDREKCYIANIVKCRPPRNRDPQPQEQDACIGFLENQIALLQPKIIVCLGRIAAQRLIAPEFRGHAPHPSGFQDLLRTRTVHRKGRHPLHRALSPLRPPPRPHQAPRNL